MRKVIYQVVVSLNGYYKGRHGAIDWHRVDKEYDAYAAELLDAADTIILGRVTYVLMSAYWPTDAGKRGNPVIAERMNRMSKIVFSRTLNNVEWEHARLATADPAQELSALKAQPGRSIVVLGSGQLAAELADLGLIDECQVMINPVALGEGTPIFHRLSNRLELHLASVRSFRSGNVMLCYEPLRSMPK
ncbi:dihydrofolate reductase family protein [Paenibacillus sp. J5C_2022]|uniref:dihydrofolate reductase family protein n=1 Tax=Paenibacillus sp. J5C2022 TaxID=2977129 RepID=UPI0021D08416|nr:dihydrofolate reductase family protein [Paenibacillus sp. J5C2022]MCU6710006.1 dihydrofolate reductase family protein [Paenibacillus sp. J5C2022]